MKYTILSLKSLAITAAGCALLGISATAFAMPILTNAQPFTVDEGAIPDTPDLQFTADRFNGSYNEVFTALDGTNFQAKTVFSFGSYAYGTSGSITQWMGGPETTGYQLYALLDSNGTYTTSGGVTSFIGSTNNIEIWADPLSDTDVSLPGDATGSYSYIDNGDDILLASATAGFGQGSVNGPSLDPGNFGILFSDFSLTPTGEQYFIAPVPFYADLQAQGNFNTFVPSAGQSSPIQGVANGYFGTTAVPGPGSLGLAMLGLALLGLGFITKRSQSAKGA